MENNTTFPQVTPPAAPPKRTKTPVIVLIIVLAVLGLAVLVALFGEEDDAPEATSSVSAASATPAQSQAPPADGEGDIGDYHIKIVSARLGKDYSDKDVLIVTYEWTNNGDEEQSFSLSFSDKAYQDGIECSSSLFVDGVDINKLSQDVKPGATLTLEAAYLLNDTSDVTVEVGPWISWGNETKVTKVFSVS